MTDFYGADIALRLLPGLAHHNTKAIELTKLEPDIAHNLRDGHVPIAIVVIKAIGEIGWAHVAAIVDGWGVIVDGPRDTGSKQSVHPRSQAEIDALVATLDRVATPWLADDHEALGVTDAALAVRIMLRRLDPQQLYKVHVSSGPDIWIIAYRDQLRLPAAIRVSHAEGGIELTSGTSKRVIKTMLELITGFPAHELAPIKADVAWSMQFLADLARAKQVATAVMQRAQGRLMDHKWSLQANLETYFSRTNLPQVSITGDGTWNVADAWFEAVPGAVKITCRGGFEQTVADPAAAEAAIDDILSGLKASMTVVTRGSIREGRRYRAKQLFCSAQPGDIVTFRGIQDQRVVEVWQFGKGDAYWFGLDDKDEMLDRLADYLEPIP